MIAFFFLLTAISAFSADCVKYEVLGKVNTLPGEYELVILEGTRSEKRFLFQHKDIPKIAPYAEKFLKGHFFFQETDPVSGAKVAAIEKLQFAAPDSLKTEMGLVKLGVSACPKQ